MPEIRRNRFGPAPPRTAARPVGTGHPVGRAQCDEHGTADFIDLRRLVQAVADQPPGWQPGGRLLRHVGERRKWEEEDEGAARVPDRQLRGDRPAQRLAAVIRSPWNTDPLRRGSPDGYQSQANFVDVELTKEGRQKLARLTKAHQGKPLAILVDGEVVAAPVVRDEVTGNARISGNFSKDEAERIAKGIKGK
jgi:SecD/SecF fusion protein